MASYTIYDNRPRSLRSSPPTFDYPQFPLRRWRCCVAEGHPTGWSRSPRPSVIQMDHVVVADKVMRVIRHLRAANEASRFHEGAQRASFPSDRTLNIRKSEFITLVEHQIDEGLAVQHTRCIYPEKPDETGLFRLRSCGYDAFVSFSENGQSGHSRPLLRYP